MYLNILGWLLCCLSSIAIAGTTSNTYADNTSHSTLSQHNNGKSLSQSTKVVASPNSGQMVSSLSSARLHADANLDNTIKQYILKHPEVLLESLHVYQQQQMQSMAKMFKESQDKAGQYSRELFYQATDPILGNAQGDISLVEFSDYQCGHCAETTPIIAALLQANSKLRVIVKELPIRGGVSDEAALAALAANKQNKYQEFRDILFQNSSTLTSDKIYSLAATVGINVTKLKQDMKDPIITAVISANKALAVNLKIIGTPAFFLAKTSVGNLASIVQYMPGLIPQQKLQLLIDNLSSNMPVDSDKKDK
jgi:protein-disulfide isomerase